MALEVFLGGGGGKGAEQGERRPAPHVSDTERNTRAPWVGRRATKGAGKEASVQNRQGIGHALVDSLEELVSSLHSAGDDTRRSQSSRMASALRRGVPLSEARASCGDSRN